jgi:two-component system response regulator (stage 0 sporulation protein A)
VKDIEKILRKLGVGSNYSGYRATIIAVKRVVSEPDRILYVTKELYPEVAHQCGCSIYSVERNIRTASHVAWRRNRELLVKIAQYPMSAPPSASQFIDILAAYMTR